MITPERIRELRTIYEATKDAPESRIDLDAWEVIESFEALFRENAELTKQAERIFPMKDMADKLAIDNLNLSFSNENLEKKLARFRTLAKRLAVFTQGKMPLRRNLPLIEKLWNEILKL